MNSLELALQKGYYADNEGNVYSRYKKLKPIRANRFGHKSFTIRDSDGKCASIYVHRFVWTYFNGAIEHGLVIDHINGIADDNRLVNLRCVSRQKNSSNSWRDREIARLQAILKNANIPF